MTSDDSDDEVDDGAAILVSNLADKDLPPNKTKGIYYLFRAPMVGVGEKGQGEVGGDREGEMMWEGRGMTPLFSKQ